MAIAAIARILLQSAENLRSTAKSIETLANHSHVVSDVLKAKEEGRGARCVWILWKGERVEKQGARVNSHSGGRPPR